MEIMKRIVIVGATSSIAEHCARIWIKQNPAILTLVARDQGKAETIAADLKVRSPESEIQILTTDFLDPLSIAALVKDAADGASIDLALIAHGSLPDQQTGQENGAYCKEALLVNGLSPALFAEAFATHMSASGKGTIAIIGSVAGDRGRKSNYIYGAAKGLVTRYAQGLQHRFANSGVRIVLIKPGPTDTPMTAHLKQAGARLAPVDEVAEAIVAAIDKGKNVAYVPGKWQLIMLVIRHLPSFIFNKMNI
jgi:decaprenylphospho-beta-D-erythro-pentofuranosid-2-ulose 2-reductase